MGMAGKVAGGFSEAGGICGGECGTGGNPASRSHKREKISGSVVHFVQGTFGEIRKEPRREFLYIAQLRP